MCRPLFVLGVLGLLLAGCGSGGEETAPETVTQTQTVTTVVTNLPKPGETVPAFELPAIEVPAGVPTADEVNAASFTAIENIVANQKAFAEKFLAAAKV